MTGVDTSPGWNSDANVSTTSVLAGSRETPSLGITTKASQAAHSNRFDVRASTDFKVTEHFGFTETPNAQENMVTKKHVLEVAERYEEVDGRFPLTGIAVVYRSSGILFHTILRSVNKPPPNEFQQLAPTLPNQGTLIPPDAYAPFFPADGSISRAPNPLPEDIFIKRPTLIHFDRYLDQGSPNAVAEALLSEARVSEILRRHPHPNIAEYHGCEVSRDGRTTGLCWTRLGGSLMQRVNPRFIGKGIFKYRPGSLYNKDDLLDKIKAGIEHIHRIGLVHNDINPSNIMFDKNDNPLIIDFGSCTPIGYSLEHVGRTYQWFDENVRISTPRNDLDGLEEIREWLREGGSKQFQFAA
ncbi:hypothetical protein MKZ38_010215 [Zalerion maritima]|uniref:Protein kinase domain-containing protein n=1 Tax=Zalerion maritima TaxID=339359 RepID=A0AAD5RG66_9PEZI|nr:hypothetical protein MKZ38_010215 [Zalerion maritima]